MTWASFATKSLSFLIVLPLVLNRFSTEEIALWYLFATITSLTILFDMGFSPTFIRVISHAMGGQKDILKAGSNFEPMTGPNFAMVERIVNVMQYVYFFIAVTGLVLLATAGTAAISKTVSSMDIPLEGYYSWMIVVPITSILLYSNVYSNYLQGMNEVALVRRWEAAASVASIFTGALILYFNGSFLAMVAGTQVWVLLNCIRNFFLCRHVNRSLFRVIVPKIFDRAIFSDLWPNVWKSGMGLLMTHGIIQLSSILYAQFTDAASLATYLLALNLIYQVRNFSMAPFYSKLPLFAKLFVRQDNDSLIMHARKSMRLSHLSFVLGFAALAIFAPVLLQMIGSKAEFAGPLLWSLMGVGFFLERYGAMHVQLYSISNHIIWHIANTGSGIICMAVSLALAPLIGIYAFPIGIIAGHAGFYTWYTAKNSLRLIRQRFLPFELSVSVLPFLIMLVFVALHLSGTLPYMNLEQ
jgi:hypothetical protein